MDTVKKPRSGYKKKIHPTEKQRRAFQIAKEDPTKAMHTVMLEAGYSHNAAIAPTKNLTGTETWQALMEEYLPDKLLSSKHHEFLVSPRVVTRYKRGDIIEEYTETSPQAVKALDMAYKLKGRYSDITIDKALIVQVSSPIADKYATKVIEQYNGSTEPSNEQNESKS